MSQAGLAIATRVCERKIEIVWVAVNVTSMVKTKRAYGLLIEVEDKASVIVFFSLCSLERFCLEWGWLDTEGLSEDGCTAEEGKEAQHRHLGDHL